MESEVIQSPPHSWITLCIEKGMCDAHLDALSCLQSAVGRGFHIDAIRGLVQLYTEHGFLHDQEGDLFLAGIPTAGEKIEEKATVTDQMLSDPSSHTGDLIAQSSPISLEQYCSTFTESQLRTFRWIESNLDLGNHIRAAIIGPAGTGKSYLQKAIIELAKTKGLITTKVAPSGVAATLIEGTTLHNFYGLDINGDSHLEKGNIQAARLRKTDIIVIDEFSMLDFFIFRTAEGLARKFTEKSVSNICWGGRHIIMQGDPAQLPAVGRADIFSTHLWQTFYILVLRENKRSKDDILTSVLSKIRLGECDQEVADILKSRLRPPNISDLDLAKTVVI